MHRIQEIKIVYLIGQLGLGGAEQQLFYLLSNLDRKRFSPVVINLAPDQSQAWVAPIKALDVPIYLVPRSINKPKRVFQIQSLIRRYSPHIVHSWVFHTNIYVALSGFWKPTPVRVGSIRTNPNRFAKRHFLRWLGQQGLDLLISNSAVAVQSLESSRKDLVRYIPNGVPIPDPVSAEKIVKLKSELGFKSTDRLIGCIGRLDRNKNQAMLIRSFATLAAYKPDTFLVLFGNGENRSELERLVCEKNMTDRVRFLGETSQAAQYLPAFEVNCLTSYYEGMPNAIMEASAAGLPVIATDVGGASEVIEHGRTGFLVRPDDDSAFITCLEQLLTNPVLASSFGSAGMEKMRREFSLGIMVEKMMQVYESFSGQNARPCCDE